MYNVTCLCRSDWFARYCHTRIWPEARSL